MADPDPDPVRVPLVALEARALAGSRAARDAAIKAAARAQAQHDAAVREIAEDAARRSGLDASQAWTPSLELAHADGGKAVSGAIVFTPAVAAAPAPAPAESQPEAVLPVPPSLKGAAKAMAQTLDDSFTPPSGVPT